MNFTKLLRDFKKIGQKEKFLILLLLSFTFLLGFSSSYIIGFLAPIRSDSNIVATPSPQPVILSLVSTQNDIKLRDNFDVAVSLSSPDTGIEAGDFIVYFDPLIVKPLKITPGKFFPSYPVQKIENNFLKISGVVTYDTKRVILPKGKADVATISFQTLKKTDDTLIYFDPDHTIVASNGRNILNTMSSLSLAIK